MPLVCLNLRAVPRTFVLCFSTGSAYWVVGGQHGVAALKELREERAAIGDSVEAKWLNVVVCSRLMRHGTSLDQLQCLAGDHQAAQSASRSLRTSQFLALALKEGPEVDMRTRIARAVQKSGWARSVSLVCFQNTWAFHTLFSRPQEAYLKKWGPIVRFCVDFGPAVVAGVGVMEMRAKQDIHGHLLALRGVIALEQRTAVATFLAGGPSPVQFKSFVESETLAQWVNWHFSSENPHIHQSLGMPRPWPWLALVCWLLLLVECPCALE